MSEGIKVTNRTSTFEIMRSMMKKGNGPTKNELAAKIVENSLNKNYTFEKAKKTVSVRLNHLKENLKKQGKTVVCRLHKNGEYRYTIEKIEA